MTKTKKNETNPLKASYKLLIALVFLASAALVIFLTGLFLAGCPLLDQIIEACQEPIAMPDPDQNPGWGPPDDWPEFRASVSRQEEVIYYDDEALNEGANYVLDGISAGIQGTIDSGTENLATAESTAGSVMTFILKWAGTFWKGVTWVGVLTGIIISAALGFNIAEENYIIGGIVGVGLSLWAVFGYVSIYFQVIDQGMFLHLIIIGLISFGIITGPEWGKTGYYIIIWGVVPVFAIAGWLLPDAVLLNGYANWLNYAEAINDWAIGVTRFFGGA